MTSIHDLKLASETLEALNFLLQNTVDLERAISSIDLTELKNINRDGGQLKERIEKLVAEIQNDKSSIEEIKRDIETKANATKEKIAEFDNTASTLNAKYTELAELQARLRNLEKDIKSLLSSGLINDATESTTQTFSSKKITKLLADKGGGLDGIKVGAYLLWSSQSVTPAGFLVCDGRSLKKSEYAELFAVIGYTYGGSGENFNLPVFNDGRFMRSTGGEANSLGVLQNATQIPNIGIYRGDSSYVLTTPRVDSYGANTQLSTIDADNSSVGPVGPYPSLTLGSPSGGTSAGTYSAIRPKNSSVVVLIKAKYVKEPSIQDIDKDIHATDIKAGIVKLKQEITGEATDCAVSEKAVSKIKNQILGVGQEYKDVLAQRRLGEIYENTTGRLIYVCVSSGPLSGSCMGQFTINKKPFATKAANGSEGVFFSVPVPAGATYSISFNSGTPVYWFELR
jgi:hypothetical protein|nr:MAG TPA: tail collar domain [Caudoviricetes sp.]